MKNLKFHLPVVVLALSLACILYAYYKARLEINAYRQAKMKEKEQILQQAKEIRRVVNEKGLETVLFDVTDNHRPLQENYRRGAAKDLIDTAAMALDIRNDQLQHVTVINAALRAENLQLKSRLDEQKRPYYTYDQNGLSMVFRPPADSAHLATADFTGRLGITVARGHRRKWIFGAERELMSITSDSPYFKIDQVRYTGFDSNRPVAGLEIQAAASYSSLAGPGMGPALQLEFGRLNLQGTYQYYQQQKNWMFGANASFRIAKY